MALIKQKATKPSIKQKTMAPSKQKTTALSIAAQSFKNARLYAFNKISTHTSSDMSREIEKSILEYTKQAFKNNPSTKTDPLKWSDVRVRRLYIRKLRMVICNIYRLLEMIDARKIAVCEIAFQTHIQIEPERWNPIVDKMKKREMMTSLVDNDGQSYEGMLKCNHCSSWNTRYVEFQTRSADEPLTVFMRCEDCGVHETLRG